MTLYRTITLTRAIAIKKFTLLRRYPVNTISEILMMYVFFAVVVFGGRAIAGEFITDSLPGIIIGFFLLTMASVAYADVSWDLIHEAQWGTLEQLFMSPSGFGRVVVLKSGVNLLVTGFYGTSLLALMMVTTGQALVLDLVTIIPIVVLSLASAIGIGFALGGLALLYKRIESTFQIVQFAFIGFVASPIDQAAVLKVLPLSLGSYLLRLSMGEGLRLWELPPADVGLLVAKAVAYLIGGYFVFQLAARKARENGVLGHY